MNKPIFLSFIVGLVVGGLVMFILGRVGILPAKQQVIDIEQVFSELKQNPPIVPNILISQGFVYFRKGDNAAAVTLADKALEQEPNNVDALVLKAYALTNDGDKVKAKQVVQQALGIDPNNKPAQLLLETFK